MIKALILATAIAQTGNGAAPPAAEAPSSAPPSAPASAPSSRPANLASGGTGADMTADVTMIFELDENRFKVQESWTLQNNSQKMIDSVSFAMPDGTFRLTLDEDVKSFAANEPGTAFGSTGPLGPGQHTIGAAYFLSTRGASTTVRRKIPVNLTSMRLIIEDVPGLSVSGNTKVQCRKRELNGLNFNVCTFAGIQAGQVLETRFTGLPSRSTWLRSVAILLSIGAILWMVFALSRGAMTATASPLSAVAAPARRDQIVRALELLKEDFEAERVTEKRYERRQRELMDQLADVLREIDLAKASR